MKSLSSVVFLAAIVIISMEAVAGGNLSKVPRPAGRPNVPAGHAPAALQNQAGAPGVPPFVARIREEAREIVSGDYLTRASNPVADFDNKWTPKIIVDLRDATGKDLARRKAGMEGLVAAGITVLPPGPADQIGTVLEVLLNRKEIGGSIITNNPAERNALNNYEREIASHREWANRGIQARAEATSLRGTRQDADAVLDHQFGGSRTQYGSVPKPARADYDPTSGPLD